MTTLELEQLEHPLDDAVLERGPTRRGRYETHGDPSHGLWLLVLDRTSRMPITGEVQSRAGTLVFRHAVHDVLLEVHPPSLTGQGWSAWLELELWFPEVDRLDATSSEHEERFVPALTALGLETTGEEIDDEAVRSVWTLQGTDPPGIARLAAGLLALPWIWQVPELR